VLARDGLVLARDGLVLARDGLVLARDGLVLARDGLVLARDVPPAVLGARRSDWNFSGFFGNSVIGFNSL